MKWLIYILACASCLGQAFTFHDIAFLDQVTNLPASGAACATANTTNAWDELLEGFNDVDGKENTWADVGTTANITYGADSSALTTYKPTGACDKAWKLVVPTDGTETYSGWDRGSAIDIDTLAADIYLSLYVEVKPDANEYFNLLDYNVTSGVSEKGILLRSSAAAQLNVISAGASGSDAINISTGQWYVLKLHLATTAAESTLTVWSNGALIGSVDTFTRSAGIDLRYIKIGAPFQLDANDSGTIWVDLIAIHTP